MKLNRAQIVALYSLSIDMGPQAKLEIHPQPAAPEKSVFEFIPPVDVTVHMHSGNKWFFRLPPEGGKREIGEPPSPEYPSEEDDLAA